MCQSTSSETLKTKSQYLGKILTQCNAVLKTAEISMGREVSDQQTCLTHCYLSRIKCTRHVMGERKQGEGPQKSNYNTRIDKLHYLQIQLIVQITNCLVSRPGKQQRSYNLLKAKILRSKYAFHSISVITFHFNQLLDPKNCKIYFWFLWNKDIYCRV